MKIIVNLFKPVLIFFAEIILLVLLVEGLSSFALSFTSAFLAEDLAYTRYDEFLGWAGKPDVQDRNRFGPGLSFRTNSQGFRNAENFDKAVPKGKIRVICSGDAYTQGLGVDNDRTWPAQLATLDWRLQTVNMGQAGYGLDQAYLRYIREGLALEHKIHIFALTSADFFRVKNFKFLGLYDKPVISLESGAIKVKNVPVPGNSFWVRRWHGLARVARGFKAYELFSGLKEKLIPRPAVLSAVEYQEIKDISLALFSDLERKITERSGRLIIVFLPLSEDYYRDDTDTLRAWLKSQLKERGIVMFDLVDELRRLSLRDYGNFFRNRYSEAGNRFIAQYLYNALTAAGYLT